MESSSRVLVAPGLRTPARLDWRAGVVTAFSIVTSSSRLWALGTVGFTLRGGILLLIMPIVVLPTQVEARLLLGRYLGSTGFTSDFFALLVGAAVVAVLLTIGILLVLARTELASFDEVIRDPSLADHSPFTALPLDESARRHLFVRLFAVQVMSLIALVLCAAPVALSVIQTSYDEVTLPTSNAPIYERVLGGVGEQLFFLLIALVIIEMVGALTSRELLVRAYGWRETSRQQPLWLLPALGTAVAQPFRAPVRTLATSVLAWALTAITVIAAIWTLGLAWAAVRGSFLTSTSFSDVGDDLQMILAALALAAVFALSIGTAGFVSALRAALWSVDRLR